MSGAVRRAARWALVVSCEHGGNEVPAELEPLFAARREHLTSHRGWDPGALELAERLAQELGAPLVVSRLSRLVVDPNRSPHNRACFSEVTRPLSRDARRELLARHHAPHRRRVQEAVAAQMRRGGPVVHLGVHTFTPVLDGVERRVEIGLLYDPRRANERAFCRRLGAELKRRLPKLRVRYNNPYRGRSDGLTTTLRRRWGDDVYLGVELEVSQRLLVDGGDVRRRVLETIPAAVADALAAPPVAGAGRGAARVTGGPR